MSTIRLAFRNPSVATLAIALCGVLAVPGVITGRQSASNPAAPATGEAIQGMLADGSN